MIESRGWAHDDDLFGGREIGQSDQVSFLILIVPRLLRRAPRRFCGVETFDALAGPSRQVSKKRPDAGAERVVSDHEADESVDFVQGLRVKRSPYGASTRTIALSTAIPSRKFVLRSLTEPPKMRLEGWECGLPPPRT